MIRACLRDKDIYTNVHSYSHKVPVIFVIFKPKLNIIDMF
jgi:hypothetical protein